MMIHPTVHAETAVLNYQYGLVDEPAIDPAEADRKRRLGMLADQFERAMLNTAEECARIVQDYAAMNDIGEGADEQDKIDDLLDKIALEIRLKITTFVTESTDQIRNS